VALISEDGTIIEGAAPVPANELHIVAGEPEIVQGGSSGGGPDPVKLFEDFEDWT
jgi:hypothetical protein